MYKILEHTADIGIEVESLNLEKAFEEAALAMISLSIDINKVDKTIKKNFNLSAENYDSLLVKFLSEILYLFDAEQFVPGYARVKINGLTLNAELVGEKYNREKHGSYLVIKAVTYHMLMVDKTGRLRVLFDI
ncbi:MAG: archease [Thermoplasmata archaeon]